MDRVFSARRMEVARLYRGLSKTELAGQMDIPVRTVNSYEDDSRLPEHEVVLKLAFRLKFPSAWFYRGEIDIVSPSVMSFRSRRSMTAGMRSRAVAAATLASGVCSPFVHKYLPLSDLLDLSDETPEQAAQMLRDHWILGEGPIANMIHLLEAKGVGVYWWREPSAIVDAVSFWQDEKAFVMLNAHITAPDRIRYNLAHELGHLVLHRSHDRKEQGYDDRQSESEANRFASAFLMPADTFRQECPTQPHLDMFFPVKQRWGVSIAAMVRRCRDIGVFSDWQYECGFKEISMRHWRLSEPEVGLKKEESYVYAAFFNQIKTQEVLADKVAKALALPMDALLDTVPTAQQYRTNSGLSMMSPDEGSTSKPAHSLSLVPLSGSSVPSTSQNFTDEEETPPRRMLKLA